MRTIDLNADLGEGGSQDEALLTLASSANIACGGHAGDSATMQAAIAGCLRTGTAIGAHPGYEDRTNFGRRPLALHPVDVADMVSRQVERLATLALHAGATIHHVKPHGALYHQADGDPALAAAVATGVTRVLPRCAFYVPPAGALAAAGQAAGLMICAEGFADRRYQPSGALVPRSDPDAVIDDVSQAVTQAQEIALRQRVQAVTGSWIPLPARTLCVHGDNAAAVALLRAVRQALTAAGCTIHA